MSWQAYVDSSLVGSGTIDKAAIWSRVGDSAWATSAGFNAKPEEIGFLASGFDKPSNMFDHGFHVAGQKYFTIKADDRSIYGKQGTAGVLCVRTKQAILIAHYPESVQPGSAVLVVEKLADYLLGLGY